MILKTILNFFTGWFAPQQPAQQQVRCYIAGPITGKPDRNAPAFRNAAKELRERGFYPINPLEVCPEPGIRWEDAMRADIPELCSCSHIALLPGWEESRGASAEKDIADMLGMQVIALEGQR